MVKVTEVYIIDDEAKKANRYKTILESQGNFKVKIINSYEQWEQILEKGIEPNAILCMDETLRGWHKPNGINLGGTFKEKWKINPLIIYSSLNTSFEQAYKAGAQYYLSQEVLADEQTFPKILTGIVANITEALQLNTLQQLMDDLPLEFMLVDSDYRIRMVNKKKKALRGKELIGKICHQVFYNRSKPCTSCPVQQVMNNNLNFASDQKWLDHPIIYEKAKAYVNSRFLSITAYPVMTPEGRLIAEIVDDQTDAKVIDTLTQQLADVKDFNEVMNCVLDNIIKLGYTRARIYLAAIDESNIGYVDARNMKTILPRKEFINIGNQAIKILEQRDEQVVASKWPNQLLIVISGIDKLEFEEGWWIIYSFILQNHKSKERKILGILSADRKEMEWEIDEADKKTMDTICKLVSNKIEALKAAKIKEEEARLTEHYFTILRDLLIRILDINSTPDITTTMLHYSNQIMKDSDLTFHFYEEQNKRLEINSEDDLHKKVVVKAYIEQNITIDKKSYANLQAVQDKKPDISFSTVDESTAIDKPFLAVPFTAKKEKYGVLLACKNTQIPYKEIEIEMVHTIVNACAMDLFNNMAELRMEEVVSQWKSLGLLHKYVQQSKSVDELIKQCLTFVTAGEGLAYNRALFFEYNPDKNNYQFKQAIGPVTKDDYNKTLHSINDESLNFEDLLKRAAGIKDPKINDTMKDCIIDSNSHPLWEVLQQDEAEIIDLNDQTVSSELPIIRELNERIGFFYYIVIKVPGTFTPLGCLLVDRKFDVHTFNVKDHEFLKTFASEMERIFEIFDYKEKMIQSQNASTLGWMTSAIGHELQQPSLGMHAAADLLIHYIDNGQLAKARVKAMDIIEAKNRITDTIEAIKGFIDTDKREKINPAIILDQSRLLFEKKLANHNVECTVKKASNLPEIEIHSTSLKYAMINLIKNTFDEFEDKDKKIKNPVIEISCYREMDNIIFEVKDNAGGIDPVILEKINKPDTNFSTKSSKGWGFGLNVVRKAAQLHNGSFIIKNREDIKGIIAQIIIPIKE